jgi:cytochrome b subunit of formate dehydrogenase
MGGIHAPLSYLLVACGITTAILVVLVIYGNSLSVREEDQIYLNKGDEAMLAADQKTLVAKMDRLEKVIFTLAVIAGILVIASTGTWIWMGLR